MGVADPSGKLSVDLLYLRVIITSKITMKLCLAHAYHSSHALNTGMPLSLKVADRPIYITWSCI